MSMPLINSSSKEARQQNIETEIHAGKPIKQAVAIGYSEQRQAGGDTHESRTAERHEHEARKYGK